MTVHVAVLMGGWSAERDVSLVSGRAVANALKSRDYQVTEIDVGRDLAAELRAVAPDVVFNALHGQGGEDGCVQGLLEVMRLPYTHSGVMASALAMDKPRTKKMLAAYGIPVAADKVVSSEALFSGDPLPRPYVIKPYNEGSSVGVCIVTDDTILRPDMDGPWQSCEELMVEAYLPGRELTCTVMGGKALAITELKPKAGFYDYNAKYQDGRTEHVLPAELNSEMTEKIMGYAKLAHDVLGCKGVSRADFRLDDSEAGDHVPYILEVNTQPGMTPLSLAPEQAAYKGLSFADLVVWMVEDASCQR